MSGKEKPQDLTTFVNKLSRADLDNELAKRGLSTHGPARKRKMRLLAVLEAEESVEDVKDGGKTDDLTINDNENDPEISENADETRPEGEAHGADESRLESLEQNVAQMKEKFDEQTNKILKMLQEITIRENRSETLEQNSDDDIFDSDKQDGADDNENYDVKVTTKDVKMKRFDSESSLTNKELKDLKRKFDLHSQALYTEIDDITNAMKDDENDCTVKVNTRRLEKETEKCELIIDKMIEIQDEYPTEIDEILKHWTETRENVRKAERNAEEYLKRCRVKDRADERKKDNVKLPNYKVPEFHGNILQWPSWIQSFTRVIDNNKDLSISAKYEYLMDRLKGEAKEAVRGYGGDEKNYSKVMDTLKSRYGDERLITKRYLESILATKEVDKKSVTSIRTLYNHLSNAYGTLESYNITKESFYLAMFEKTLPPELKQEWEKRHSRIRRERSDKKPVTVQDFFDFLLDEVKSLEATEKVNLSTDKRERKSPHPRVRNYRDDKEPQYEDLPSSGQALLTRSVPTKNCVFCNKSGHSSAKCHEAQKMDIDERWKIVSTAKVCFNCLLPMGRDHNSSTCKAPRCGQNGCTGKHAAILHKERVTEKHASSTSNLTSSTTGRQKLCPLAMGTLIYEDKEVPVRVFLDSGSKDSYILNNIAESLDMEKIHPVTVLNTVGFGGVSVPQQSKRVKFSLSKQHRQPTDEVVEIEAWTTKKICDPVEPIDIDFKQFEKLKGLQLADVCPRGAMTVDVLIGIDYLDCFLGNNKFKVADKLYTQETVFGWIVRGVMPEVHAHKLQTMEQAYTQTMLVDTHDINEQLKAFWELETIGIHSQATQLTPDEQEAVRQFDEKLKFKENDGRYEVGLLWKTTHPELTDNYDQALKRLESVERMLQRNPDKCEMYCESMNSYINNGHAREVKKDDNESATTVRYLPHHPVFRQDKVTSKCRIVFDASAKSKDEVSLNDCLLEGPNILPDMTQVLMRFRCNRIGLSSDIKSMFLQIMLQEQDQQVHRFLWREMNTDIEPKVYCKTRVTFGVKSSPFVSEATVHKHAELCRKDFPLAAAEVKENMYMDDYVGGADTPQQAIELQRNMTEMMKLGAFSLTKWASNSDDVLRQIPEDEINPQLIIDFDSIDYETLNTDSTTLKMLGIVWDTSDDCLLFKPTPRKMNDLNTETKRTLLSKVATTFDPLGMYAPFTVRAKKMIQDTWIKGLQWDEPLPPDIGKDFDKWKLEHEQLNTIRLPRCFKEGLSTIIDAQLHGFSDASERSFGGAIYLRLKDEKNNVKVHLVMSKSRLAPVKKLTLPKLELCGALVMTRLMLYVKEALHFELSKTFCWTDSMITLSWIQKHASFWKNFVANRVQEIQDKLDPSSWRHVPGEENPSDLLTRGISITELKNSQLWWTGPKWLSLPEEKWPSRPVLESKESLVEVKGKKKSTTLVASAEKDHEEKNTVKDDTVSEEYPYFAQRIESWNKLIRVTARILTLKNPSDLKQTNCRELNADELKVGAETWLKAIQNRYYKAELDVLTSGKSISVKSHIVELDPILENGLIKVGGRLHQAQIAEDAKHQVILPHKDPVVAKLIMYTHLANSHAGPETTLAILREKYWITQGRREVKRVLKNDCLKCRHQKTVTQKQKMGTLPQERLRTWPHAGFIDVGIDFTGPVFLKEGKERRKAWICLFVCGNTRALHLELTLDMTTETFLDAYRRMINRRGISYTIHSDNQTSFHKSSKVLKAAFSDAQKAWKNIDMKEVERQFATKGIRWKFITPRASHQGGWWERYCRMLKQPLKIVLGKALLTYQEMETVLTDIEAQVNSRPLTYVGDDIKDGMVITPAHLLIGRPLGHLPQVPNSTEEDLNIQKRFLYRQRIADHFWRRWQKEYLPNLNVRKKWKTEEPPLKVNDVVLVCEDKTPRNKWIIAKVQELRIGRDGLIRNVKVKTAKGLLNRPVQKLHLLEVA